MKQHFAGKKVGFFYQNDEFGQDGVKGLLDELPASMVVSKQTYDPTNTNIGPAVAALRASGAQLVVSFSIPAFTALLRQDDRIWVHEKVLSTALGTASQANPTLDIGAVAKKLTFPVHVNPRYGAWDAKNFQFSADAKATLPAFLKIKSTLATTPAGLTSTTPSK